MQVADRMKGQPITVTPQTTVMEAVRLLTGNRIRHLPVVEGKRVVGMVTDRDLKRVAASPAIPVSGVMTKPVITVKPDSLIEEAAQLLVAHKIGGLPVVEEDRLVGILTETDVLEAFVELVGIQRRTTRLEIAVERRPEALRALGEALQAQGGDIVSIVMGRRPGPSGKEVLVVRVEAPDLDRLLADMRRVGFPPLAVASMPTVRVATITPPQ